MRFSETKMYPAIKEFLERNNYEVFPEVQPYAGWNRIDVYAKNDNASIIVEMKNTLSLKVIDQAYTWLVEQAAEYIFIAIPLAKKELPYGLKGERMQVPPIVRDICRKYGLGIIMVDMESGFADIFIQPRRQYVNERIANKIDSVLSEYHKEQVGGSQYGITSFEVTTRRIVEYLESRRDKDLGDVWVSLEQVAKEVQHHYEGKTPGKSIRGQMERYRSHLFEFTVIKRKAHIKLREGYKDAENTKTQNDLANAMGSINIGRGAI